MKRNFWMRLPLIVLGAALIITAAAWQDHSATNGLKGYDTVPKERNKKARNIDEALEQIEKAKIDVDRSFKEVDWEKIEKEMKESMKQMDVDLSKMKAEMERSFKEVDMTKVKADLDKAMKELDLAKVQINLDKELKNVDKVKIQAEIDKAMKEIDVQKIMAETQASIAKVDWDNIKKEIEKVKSVDVEKIRDEIAKVKPDLERSMKDAHESIEKAKVQLRDFKGFIDGLEKDGLISKKGTFTIEHEDGVLTINGRKQSDEVYNRYRSFLQKYQKFSMKQDDDDFDLDID
jgi:membrane-associated HD superfamily phosphohydrolase